MYIHIALTRPDGSTTTETCAGEIAPVKIEAAEDLLETLSTGERPVPRGLYVLVAQAFGVDREEAKRRLLAASYGATGETLERLAKGKIEEIVTFGKGVKRHRAWTIFNSGGR